MSRIGNRVLKIPESLSVTVVDSLITLSSGKDKLEIYFNKFHVKPVIENGEFKTFPVTSSKQSKAQFGTINALVNSGFIGLTEGFVKHLEIVGVGYKAALENGKLKLALGFSHPVFLEIPAEIKLEIVSSVEIKLSSYNKESLGQFASLIRKLRMPEPYKGKGIKYKGEYIARKVGKTSDGKK